MFSDYRSLRKILLKEPLNSLLMRLIKNREGGIQILDSTGQFLLGNESIPHSYKHPVYLEKKEVGYVTASSDAGDIAELLSFAILKEFERRSLGRDLLEKYKEITVLYDIPEKLASSMRINEIADVITHEVKRLIPCDCVSLMLFGLNRFFINTGSGKVEKLPDRMDFLKHAGIAREIFSSGTGEIINDVSGDKRYVPGEFKVGSLVCVPVCIRENSYGVINISARKKKQFTSADLRLASALAFQAAYAIENSEFYEQLEEKVKARTQELAHANKVLNLEIKNHKETRIKLDAEIRQARDYIRKILPEPFENERLTLRWTFIPSTLLGGDCFGYRWIDPDHFAVYLIDVCGHGVGAALLSVSIVNVLRSGSFSDNDMKDAGKVLRLLNEIFPAEENNHNYFTLWYGVIDKRKNTLTCSSGGHPSPIALTNDKKLFELEARNPAVGIIPNYPFESSSFPLNRINKILLFSDGVFEIRSKNGETRNYSKFKEVICKYQSSGSILDDLEHHSLKISENDGFEDDYTMIEIGL